MRQNKLVTTSNIYIFIPFFFDGYTKQKTAWLHLTRWVYKATVQKQEKVTNTLEL